MPSSRVLRARTPLTLTTLVALASFAAFGYACFSSAYADHGLGMFAEFFRAASANPIVLFALVDYTLICLILSWVVVRRARERGVKVAGWLAAVWVFGTGGLVAFLRWGGAALRGLFGGPGYPDPSKSAADQLSSS